MAKKVKALRSKADDIRYIATIGESGMSGELIKITPLKNDTVAQWAGVKLAEALHGVLRKDIPWLRNASKTHFSFELVLENGEVSTQSWLPTRSVRESAWPHLRDAYPNALLEHGYKKMFPNIVEGEYLAAGQIRGSYACMPIRLIKDGKSWNAVISSLETQDKDLRVVIQILARSVKRFKGKSKAYQRIASYRTPMTTARGSTVSRPAPDIELSDQISKKLDLPHFWVEIRACAAGKDKNSVQKTLQTVLELLTHFGSEHGGNKLSYKAIKGRSKIRSFINAMEDRDFEIYTFRGYQRRYPARGYRRLYLSTEELGYNFLTLPTQEPIPPNYKTLKAAVYPLDKKAKEAIELALLKSSAGDVCTLDRILIPGINGVKMDPECMKEMKREIDPVVKYLQRIEKEPAHPAWKEELEYLFHTTDDINSRYLRSKTDYYFKLQQKYEKEYYKKHPEEKPLEEYQPMAHRYYRYMEKEFWYQKLPEYISRGMFSFGYIYDPAELKFKPAALDMKRLKYHVLVLGESGAGKSNLITLMATDCIAIPNMNVIIFDPHDDHQNRTLRYLSDKMADHWINIDPKDILPVGMNLLHYTGRERLVMEGDDVTIGRLDTMMAMNMIDMFKRIFGEEAVGAQAQDILKVIITHGMNVPGFTVVDAAKVLIDPPGAGYRFVIMEQSEGVADLFTKELPFFDARQITSSRNKLKAYSEDKILRPLFCCRDNPVEIGELIAPGKFVYINNSIKNVGPLESKLMGGSMLTKIMTEIYQKKKPNDPNEFMTVLFLDEFQTYAPFDFEEVISTARKYNTGLVLVIQYLNQMEDMLPSVENNVGTVFCFKVGHADAKEMAEWLGVRPVDLSERALYEAVVRIKMETAQGRIEASAPMTALIYPPIPFPAGWQERLERLKKASREKYGRVPKGLEQSIFSGMVQDLHDFLLALRALHLQLGKEYFTEIEIKRKMEEMACQSIDENNFTLMQDYAVERRCVETKDERSFYIKGGRRRRSGFYKISSEGTRYIMPQLGEGPIAGTEVHQWLLMQAVEFFLKKNAKLRLITQRPGIPLPDGEIIVKYDIEGLTKAEQTELAKRQRETWIYKFSESKNMNIEAVSKTLRKPEKVQSDFTRAVSAGRLLGWLVESEENANQLLSIAKNICADPQIRINEKALFSDTSFVRRPIREDFKILVIEQQKEGGGVIIKECVDINRFKEIKELDTDKVSQQSIEMWKTMLPAIEELLKDRKEPQIGLTELSEKCKKLDPNTSQEAIIKALQECEVPISEIGKDSRAWTCTIVQQNLNNVKEMLEEIEKRDIVEKEEEKKKRQRAQAIIKVLRTWLKKKELEKDVFETEGDMAKKLSAITNTSIPQWQITEALSSDNLKAVGIKQDEQGKIAVSRDQLGEESILQITKEIFGDEELWQNEEAVECSKREICLDDYGQREREKEIEEWLSIEHETMNGEKVKFECRDSEGKKYWVIETKILSKVKEERPKAKETKEIDLITYYKQYVKRQGDTVYLPHARVKAELGEHGFEKHLERAKEIGFEINERGVHLSGAALYKEEPETKEHLQAGLARELGVSPEALKHVEPLEEKKVAPAASENVLENKCYFCKKALKSRFEFTETKKYGSVCLKCYEENNLGKGAPVLTEKTEDERSIPIRILEYFEKHPEPQNTEEIADGLNIEISSALQVALRRLVENGRLQNPKRGIYCYKDFKLT